MKTPVLVSLKLLAFVDHLPMAASLINKNKMTNYRGSFRIH